MPALARAAPDGDTVGMIDPTHLLLPFAHASLPFDSVKDFTIVSVLGDAPLFLLTNPAKVQAATAQELIAAGQSQSRPLSVRRSRSGQRLASGRRSVFKADRPECFGYAL